MGGVNVSVLVFLFLGEFICYIQFYVYEIQFLIFEYPNYNDRGTC